MQGIIDRVQRDTKTGSISGEDGGQFTFDEDSLADMTFDSVVLGTRVEFEVTEAGPGEETRAVEVRPAAEQISISAVAALSPDHEVQPDLDSLAAQVPPDAVEGDKVEESSWQSFPASDPPSPGKFT